MSMPRLPIPDADDGTWGNILNNFLDQSLNADGTLKTAAVSAAGAELTTNKGQASGYASLDGSGIVPADQLPAGSLPPWFQSGDGTPDSTVTPTQQGALYQDITNGALYVAVGVTDTDWILVGGDGRQLVGVSSGTNGVIEIVSAEGAGPTLLTDSGARSGTGNGLYWQSVGADGTQTLDIFVGPGGAWAWSFTADGGLQMPAGWSLYSFPAFADNTVGNDGDWALSEPGTIYHKVGTTWLAHSGIASLGGAGVATRGGALDTLAADGSVRNVLDNGTGHAQFAGSLQLSSGLTLFDFNTIPNNAVGANGDWSFGADGNLYHKAGGVWVVANGSGPSGEELEASGSTFGTHNDGDSVNFSWSRDQESSGAASHMTIDGTDPTTVHLLTPGLYSVEVAAGIQGNNPGTVNMTLSNPLSNAAVIGMREPVDIALSNLTRFTATRRIAAAADFQASVAVFGGTWQLQVQQLYITWQP